MPIAKQSIACQWSVGQGEEGGGGAQCGGNGHGSARPAAAAAPAAMEATPKLVEAVYQFQNGGDAPAWKVNACACLCMYVYVCGCLACLCVCVCGCLACLCVCVRSSRYLVAVENLLVKEKGKERRQAGVRTAEKSRKKRRGGQEGAEADTAAMTNRGRKGEGLQQEPPFDETKWRQHTRSS